MLLKFEAVREIGRFASLKHKAPHFERLTLIFARNGYGKSTICSVLRSVSDGDSSYISARRRLDAKGECFVESKWAKRGTILFKEGMWNNSPGKIHVFDSEFVTQNLHVGESVTRDNKRSLIPVVLGIEGVKLALKISILDDEQRDLANKMKTAENVIRAKCPVVSPSTLSAFCSKEVPDDINVKMAASARTVELLRRSMIVRQKKLPQCMLEHSLSFYNEIAVRTIESVSDDAANRVTSHIRKYKLEPHGDRWLKYGVDHVQHEACPFCDRPLVELNILSAYQAYFSEAFAKLIFDRDAAIDSLSGLCVDEDNELDKIADQNEADFVFWNEVCHLPNPPKLSPEQRVLIKQGLRLLLRRLEKKIQNPLSIVEFGEDAEAIKAAFSCLATYNGEIAECRALIEIARESVGTADSSREEEKHKQWIALHAKLSEPLRSQTARYSASEIRRAQIEMEKKSAQSELSAYAKQTVESRQKDINSLLADFGANFSIIDTRASFVGREPNTEYSIAIGANKIKADHKSGTQPSFKTVLSAGDKTTLALAFFLSQVRADSDLADAVVVFDDPFCSQDLHRQFETTSQIREIAGRSCQTLVFSHDPRFLQMIERDSDNGIAKTFQLTCTEAGDGSVSLWSVADELKTEYVRQSETINEYAKTGKFLPGVTVSSLVKDLRPFLEDYIRARFPGRFESADLLIPMINAIEDTGIEDPMFASLASIRAVNEYTRGNHHGGGQTPDPAALRAQCQRIVRIVGTY